MDVTDLPTLNATLNGTAACLLTAGWVAIKRRRIALHKTLMLLAVLTSAAFLTSYLIYHLNTEALTRFSRTGWLRGLYLSILGTHTVLAAAVPFLVLITLWRAVKSRFEAHARIARWTLPIWLYVSVTGVLIYLMLYVWFPAG